MRNAGPRGCGFWQHKVGGVDTCIPSQEIESDLKVVGRFETKETYESFYT